MSRTVIFPSKFMPSGMREGFCITCKLVKMPNYRALLPQEIMNQKLGVGPSHQTPGAFDILCNLRATNSW